MSLKSKLSKFISRGSKKPGPDYYEKPEASQDASWRDLREHERFESSLVDNESLMVLEHPQSDNHQIISISYGGFGLTSTDQFPQNQKFLGTLKILGESCPVEFNIVYRTAHKIGCQFVHSDAHILVFLRSVIEYLRRGSTLFAVNQAHLKEASSDANRRLYFQGEGPIDFIVRLDKNERVLAYNLTFRDLDQYFSVQFENGNLQTAVAIDQQGVGARMAPTRELDLQILRKALFIMVGSPANLNLRGTAGDFFASMLKHFPTGTKLSPTQHKTSA